MISLKARIKPARIGEKRYLELPAMETSPFALEYCSFVRRSVMVAVNAGSRSAEKTELTITPR